MQKLLNYRLLLSRLNRTWAFHAYLLNRFPGATALRDQVACQDGSGADKDRSKMEGNRKALRQKVVNNVYGSLDLLKSWSSKVGYRQMLRSKLILAEQFSWQ